MGTRAARGANRPDGGAAQRLSDFLELSRGC
jgi:hypothetical protein